MINFYSCSSKLVFIKRVEEKKLIHYQVSFVFVELKNFFRSFFAWLNWRAKLRMRFYDHIEFVFLLFGSLSAQQHRLDSAELFFFPWRMTRERDLKFNHPHIFNDSRIPLLLCSLFYARFVSLFFIFFFGILVDLLGCISMGDFYRNNAQLKKILHKVSASTDLKGNSRL